MYVEIPTVTRCCCCAPLRCGLLLWAYLKLMASIIIFGLCLTWTVIFIAFVPHLIVYSMILITTLAIQVIDIAFNFVLVVGTHRIKMKRADDSLDFIRYPSSMDTHKIRGLWIVASIGNLGFRGNTGMLRLYYKYGVVCGVLILLLSLIWIFYEISTMSRPQSISSWKILIIMSSLVTAVLFIHVYILILTHSNIVKIDSNCLFRFVNNTTEPTCHLQATYEDGT